MFPYTRCNNFIFAFYARKAFADEKLGALFHVRGRVVSAPGHTLLPIRVVRIIYRISVYLQYVDNRTAPILVLPTRMPRQYVRVPVLYIFVLNGKVCESVSSASRPVFPIKTPYVYTYVRRDRSTLRNVDARSYERA